MLQTRRIHRLLLFILVRLLFGANEGFQLLCTNYLVTRKVFSYQNFCPKVTNNSKIYRLAIRSRCATPLLDREVRIRLRLGCEQRLSQLLDGKILRWEQCILPRDIKNNPWHFDFQIRHGLNYYVTGVFCQDCHRYKKNVKGTPYMACVSWIKIVCFFPKYVGTVDVFRLGNAFWNITVVFSKLTQNQKFITVNFLCYGCFSQYLPRVEKMSHEKKNKKTGWEYILRSVPAYASLVIQGCASG